MKMVKVIHMYIWLLKFNDVDSRFNGNQYKSIGKLVNPRTPHIDTKSTIYGLTINK